MDPFQSQINPVHIVTSSTYVTIWTSYDTGIYRGEYEWKYISSRSFYIFTYGPSTITDLYLEELIRTGGVI